MKKNNRKLTRNSFKRKIIVFGVAVFMSVAMVATGFAAWVISSNAKQEAGVGVNVAEIQKGNLTLTIDNLSDGKLSDVLTFGPRADDDGGYLKASKDADEIEDLSFVISGSVDNAQNLGGLTLTLDLTNLKNAIDANYITFDYESFGATLVDGSNYIFVIDIMNSNAAKVTYVEGTPDAETGVEKDTFSVTLSLSWGTAFGGMNPGDYYDGGIEGNPGYTFDADDNVVDVISTALKAFNTAMVGDATGVASNTIKVTVEATVA